MESRLKSANNESFERKSSSLCNIRPKTKILITNSKKFHRDFAFTPTLRKNLPQTSNLVSKLRKSPKKPGVLTGMFQDSGNSARSDFDTETIVLKGNQKVVVSCQLSVLILQVLSKYRNCPIIQDSFLSKSGIYKYLFDSNLNFIRSLEDLYEPPILVIISCRSKIPEGTLFSTRTLKERNETEENKSCNIIDMYKSIIPKAKLNRKIHKSPLYKLKAFASPTKPLKPPVPEYNHSDPLFSQIFPFSLGKKVKEGAGGFKKPVLLFEKEKSSFSPCLSSRKYSEQRLKKSASVSKSVLNDVINVDQACAKYSLPKQDFLKILNEFTYLKGFYGRLFVGTLQKAYNVSLDVFKGIGHTQNSTNEVV